MDENTPQINIRQKVQRIQAEMGIKFPNEVIIHDGKKGILKKTFFAFDAINESIQEDIARLESKLVDEAIPLGEIVKDEEIIGK
jgi:hypothetical protein